MKGLWNSSESRKILNVDISKALKLGNREVVIYNQKVVKLVKNIWLQ